MTGPAADGMLVVKLGGGLTAIPGALDAACAAVADLARRHRVVVVPGGGRVIALLGVDDIVVVDTPDALMVTTRARSQEVKKLVERCKEAGREDVV